MKILKQIDKFITAINFFLFKVGAVFTFGLVIFMFWSVIARYLFNSSNAWFDELLWHIFGFSFILASAYTLNQDGHVRVDIFYQKYSKKTKAWVDIFGVLLFLLPITILITYHGYFYALESFQSKEISGNPGGLPYRWIIKSTIPIGFFFLSFQGISHLIKQIIILKEPANASSDQKPE